VNSRPSVSVTNEAVARLAALVREYDAKWSALDLAGVADLWEDDTPQPIYIGDEYPLPLIGPDELERHWARVAGRLKRASVSSQLQSADLLADGFARCVVLSRWSFTGRESDVEHNGSSWITWMLVARGEEYRIFHHMESQVYLDDGLADDRSRRRKD
jgi:ketosteroid isomerase-like protein